MPNLIWPITHLVYYIILRVHSNLIHTMKLHISSTFDWIKYTMYNLNGNAIKWNSQFECDLYWPHIEAYIHTDRQTDTYGIDSLCLCNIYTHSHQTTDHTCYSTHSKSAASVTPVQCYHNNLHCVFACVCVCTFAYAIMYVCTCICIVGWTSVAASYLNILLTLLRLVWFLLLLSCKKCESFSTKMVAWCLEIAWEQPTMTSTIQQSYRTTLL